jgi:hypothetical protein
MTTLQDKYRKLQRLLAKRQRLNKRIAVLEKSLHGRKFRWGNCSYHGNR